MAAPQFASLMLAVATTAACAGVSVAPEHVRADSLPVARLSAAEARELGEHAERAVAAFAAGRHAEAETEANAALDLDPRSARARAVRGAATMRRAQGVDPPDLFLVHAGEADLRLAVQMAPGDAFVGWLHALALADAGHVSAAAVAAEATLAHAAGAPDDERAPLLDAAAAFRYELGEERAALPHLRDYVALRPDDAEARFRLAASHLAIAAAPTGARPQSLIEAQDHAEAAAREFQRCAELAPDDAEVHRAAGTALLRAAEIADERGDDATATARYGDAEAWFRTVAERFPNDAEALFGAGVAAEARGDEAAARAAYGAALERDAEHLGSLLHLAACAARSGEAAAATSRDLLQRALRADAERRALSDDERARIEALLAAPATRP